MANQDFYRRVRREITSMSLDVVIGAGEKLVHLGTGPDPIEPEALQLLSEVGKRLGRLVTLTPPRLAIRGKDAGIGFAMYVARNTALESNLRNEALSQVVSFAMLQAANEAADIRDGEPDKSALTASKAARDKFYDSKVAGTIASLIDTVDQTDKYIVEGLTILSAVIIKTFESNGRYAKAAGFCAKLMQKTDPDSGMHEMLRENWERIVGVLSISRARGDLHLTQGIVEYTLEDGARFPEIHEMAEKSLREMVDRRGINTPKLDRHDRSVFRAQVDHTLPPRKDIPRLANG